MAVLACNLSTQEVEEGRLAIQGHYKLYSKLEATLGYVRPYLKKKNLNFSDVIFIFT